MIVGLSGGVLVAVAAVAFYLSAPHQRWGRLTLPPRAFGWSGATALVTGAALLLVWAGTATALFIALTVLMTVWSILPVAIAWARRDREKGA